MSASDSQRNLLKRTSRLEKELAAKSYALKIESALERVSLAAMSMRRSKDLSGIGSLIFKELKKLGFTDLRNTEIVINNDAKETITSYYYSDYGITGVIELDYRSNPIVRGWAKKMKRASAAFAKIIIREKEMKQWRKYREEIGYQPDQKLNKAKTVYYYSYSIGLGALSISSFKPASKEQIEILGRFRNVFNLSYRRYADIALAETQAREAEIELALERVRARTMAMQKSEELQETTLVLFQQFKSLGVTTAQVSICVFDEDTEMGEMFVTLKGEKIDRSFKMDLDKEVFVMKEAKKAFLDKQKKFSFVVRGKELQEYNRWRNSLIGRKGWDESKAVRKQSWNVNGVFFSRGMMGISSEMPASDEAIKLLERFAGVFDLTFTRFLDLQKAEAQAREAQIEVALERVRARTMAMQKSDELPETTFLLFQQLKELGETAAQLSIGIIKEEQGIVELSTTIHGSQLLHTYPIPANDPYFMEKVVKPWKAKQRTLTVEIRGKELKDYNEWRNSVLKKKIVFPEKQWIVNVVFFSKGMISFSSDKYLPQETIQLLERFAGVFDLTYTRFLDLQKAEAQAREARIEAALERVRASSMAMHRSDELDKVIKEVTEQLTVLGFDFDASNIATDLEPEGLYLWNASPAAPLPSGGVYVPYKDIDLINWIYSWEVHEEVTSTIFNKAQKNEFFEHYFANTEGKNIPEERKKYILDAESLNFSTACRKDFVLSIFNYRGIIYTEEQNNILARFAKVFEQSYIRFLDLQKAEAQAREAQIEAALERVRSHAMAMQTSEELNALIGTVFTELTKLDLVLTRCVILIYEGNEKGVRWWMANSEAPSMPVDFFVKYADMPFFNEYLKGWQERSLKWQYILEAENKFNTDEFLFKETELSQLPDFVIAGMRAPDRVYLNASFNNFGNLTLATLESLSDEHFDILLRFAKVFDLTYTRFNDLKQAEAQVRESQIQLALERVRARTMAMHKSEELAETAQVLFHQLQALGGIPDRIAIGVADESEGVVNFWSTDQSGSHIDKIFKARLNERTVMTKTYQAWKDHKKSLVIDLHGDDVKEWIQFARQEMGVVVKDEFIRDRRVYNFVFFSHGWILITTHEPQSPEAIQILERFASVFNLTYRRFLDLEKAEAQAREAHIETALERVRAKAMAMHSSKDLAETINVFYHQMSSLSITPIRCGIGIADKETQIAELSTMNTTEERTSVEVIGKLKMLGHPVLEGVFEHWLRQMEYHPVLRDKEINDYYHLMRPQIAFPEYPSDVIQFGYFFYFGEGWVYAWTNEELKESELRIYRRFTSVLSLTYKRYKDLRQAEVQAREAQIEAALERVRAHSMAMHQSSDLHEVIKTVTEQLSGLGLKFNMANFARILPEGSWDLWLSTPEHIYPSLIHVPYIDHRIFNTLKEVISQGLDFFTDVYEGDEKNIFIRHFFENTVARNTPEERKQYVLSRSGLARSVFLTKNIWLNVSNYDGIPYSDEENAIFKRFANAFEQSYTRFLDLQKAEANVREAQIEAGLERVRARTMAMFASDELPETAVVVYKQMNALGIIPNRLYIVIINDNSGNMEFWITDENGDKIGSRHLVNVNKNISLKKMFDGWANNKKTIIIDQQANELQDWLSYWKENFHISFKDDNTIKRRVQTIAYFSKGFIAMASPDDQPQETIQVLERFAAVFNLTYTRFLDLQKAEAQAREAQIETALERVRSKAMAMHNSSDLSSAASVVFTELKKLGIRTIRSGISLQNKETRKNLLYTSTSTDKEENLSLIGWAILDDHPVLKEIYDSWMRGDDYFPVLKGDVLKSYYEKIKSTFIVPAAQAQDYEQHGYFMAFTHGMFYGWAEKPFDDNEKNILKRFASVVDLTFKRYFDLQKAESNAREAQIETALERVRSKTMAMHNSNDVGETVAAMFAEFEYLGIHTNRCGILIFNDQYTAEVWTARSTPGGNAKLITGRLDLDAHNMLRSVYDAWKAKETFYQYDLLKDNLIRYYEAINNSKFYPTQFDLNALPSKEFHSDFFFADGAVFSFTNEPLAEEHSKIMKRFAGVFGQTYRRYLDLQKAEAQAREATIEVALERVRAKAMAMHNSEDLAETIKVFYRQLETLDLMPRRCGVGLINKDTRTAELIGMVINEEGEVNQIAGKLTLLDHPVLDNVYNGWVRQEDYYPVLRGNEIRKYYEFVGSQISARNYPDDAVQFGYFFFFPEGAVYAWTENEFTEGELKIYRRFTSVLSLTYKRYKDLKQAEAQAREATIEAALEKVRSSAMAMHSSNDISSTTTVVFEELKKLNIHSKRCGVALLSKDSHTCQVYAAATSSDGKFHTLRRSIEMTQHHSLEQQYESWIKQENFVVEMRGEELRSYYQLPFFYSSPDYAPPTNYEQTEYGYYIPFSEGLFYAWTEEPYLEDEINILNRFKRIVDLTFRRYFDLQKAEAQAREATIEAALEKVRGKAMAMHNSNDLSVTASMVFTELRKLGINPIRCGVGLLSNDSLKAPLYSATSSADGDSLSLVGWVLLSGHPTLEKIYESWLKNEDYYPELGGEQLRSYYENLLSGLSLPSVPDWDTGQKQFGTFLPFSVGCLYAWSEAPYNETEIKILKRFATIIDLTFRRYIELQTSEANAREAVKQAALDRVRAEIASMRTIADLDRITPLIWNELTILGIPFIRCGVFIMDETQQLIHTFLSTPEGKAIAAFHMPYDTPGDFPEMLTHWKIKKTYLSHWGEADMMSMADILVKQGAIATKEQYLRLLPKEGFYLHFLPFLQGMLYVGNLEKLHDEEIELIEHVADAFSTAYARYEDFNKLEAAKQQVEKTLTDLKQAQTLLVQSEKMASLGELTAGIAHEIQNPLNFVNNFSEVSNELLEEMKMELERGNNEDALAIAKDVKQNLEKINHHGKRADGIVKGMLQHSRTSSGQKEMTDINSLADEYLRLAYHGLRAKDKSFNAKFETSFDKNVGEINIIPQEIGRVILNLINNAFYAVSEKKKIPQSALGGGVIYEPTVTLTTVKDNGKIEIKVKDNGNGIAQKVLEKIFQPFFTTKPTGQGTGLGLSLAYDIVKAHGGEIKVETKEGEGSEFIIQLPD